MVNLFHSRRLLNPITDLKFPINIQFSTNLSALMLLSIVKIDFCGHILVIRCPCAAASCVRDGSRPPATGLQEQVANRRKRLWLRALVVSVTEKVLLKASGVD